MAKPRRDINALSATELGDYVHALNVLRARSEADPDDPTGFAFQAALHNDGFVGPCEHGNDKFMPWHRAHLHYFEQLLQAADPPRTAGVTIPYWDWIHPEPGKFPAPFSEPGLHAPGRSTADTPLPPDTLEIVVGETDQMMFAGFPEGSPDGDYGRLEQGPHDDMHSKFIKGAMGSPSTAAEDPIYFSFHCFIDLLWDEWQRRNGSPELTSPDADLRGFLDQPMHKAGDFKSTLDLGYEYELNDKLAAAFAVPTPVAERGELVAVESLERAFDDLRAELRASERVRFRFAAPPPERRRVLVRLKNLAIPVGGNYRIDGYVHPDSEPFAPDDDEFVRRHAVGYVSVWRMHDGHGAHGGGAHPPAHHPTAMTARFDVTSALAAADVEPADLVLTLRYVPYAPDDDSEPPPELIEEVDLEDVVMEAYA